LVRDVRRGVSGGLLPISPIAKTTNYNP
jgi:hypothetical protein